MGATYEIWLTNDQGVRMTLLEKIAFLSYTRTNNGFGYCELGLPYDYYVSKIPSLFDVDWRIDIWRSPATGIPARREGSFLLRKYQLSIRTTDAMRMITLYGRSPLDILRRQILPGTGGGGDLIDAVDDLMKTMVKSRFVNNPDAYWTAPVTVNGGVYTSTGEFACDERAGDGPTITYGGYFLKSILDIVTDLKKISFALNAANSASKRIYFDVIEDDSLISPGFGYRFRTYPVLRGHDRTANSLIFSVENGNLSAPVYFEDYNDTITGVYNSNSSFVSPPVLAANWSPVIIDSPDRYLSRWNFANIGNSTSTVTSLAATTEANGILSDKGKTLSFSADFLNSPGGPTQPRSLYGVDWDMGDLLPCKFAGKVINSEIGIVYVSLKDNGHEDIVGKGTNVV